MAADCIMKCPQCQAEATQVGTFWVCGVHGSVPEPQPFATLRLFLSYGHDDNEELVRRIKADLEKHGHDVWYDKSDIGPGEAGRNPLVEMLARNAQRLPDWLGLVVTSRPEFDVKTLLRALKPFPLDTPSESNSDYLRREYVVVTVCEGPESFPASCQKSLTFTAVGARTKEDASRLVEDLQPDSQAHRHCRCGHRLRAHSYARTGQLHPPRREHSHLPRTAPENPPPPLTSPACARGQAQRGRSFGSER